MSSGPCRICGVTSSTRCTVCKVAHYCGKEHAKADWRSHKKACKIDSDPTPLDFEVDPTSANQITIKAYHFPFDSATPKIVKVKCTIESPDSSATDTHWHLPIIAPWLGNSGNYDNQKIYNTDGPGGKALKHPLRVFIRDNYMNDGSKDNLSIKGVTKGELNHEWRGDVLVVKCRDMMLEHVMDIEEGDMEYIVNYMRQYGTPGEIPQYFKDMGVKVVQL